MTLDDMRRQVGNLTTDRLTPIEGDCEGVLRGRAHCSECDAVMDMQGQTVRIRQAELIGIEQIGARVIFHFREQ